MSEQAVSHKLWSAEEYLKLEESAAVRHEYVGGMVYAMTGATKRHNRIILNIASRLLVASRGGSCRVYVETVKLRAAEDKIYYPDVMVACGVEAGDDLLIEDAPCLVVEVVSPSTESIDRREKMLAYRRIPSLRAYLIVEQDGQRVERYWRDENGEWLRGEIVADGDGAVPVPCPETVLPLAGIYEGL